MINEYFAMDILQEVCQRGGTDKMAVEGNLVAAHVECPLDV